MNRALYAAGWGYVALCGLVLAKAPSGGARTGVGGGEPRGAAAPFRGEAGEWFAQVKPFCNAVEVEVRQQAVPAPATAPLRRESSSRSGTRWPTPATTSRPGRSCAWS